MRHDVEKSEKKTLPLTLILYKQLMAQCYVISAYFEHKSMDLVEVVVCAKCIFLFFSSLCKWGIIRNPKMDNNLCTKYPLCTSPKISFNEGKEMLLKWNTYRLQVGRTTLYVCQVLKEQIGWNRNLQKSLHWAIFIFETGLQVWTWPWPCNSHLQIKGLLERKSTDSSRTVGHT